MRADARPSEVREYVTDVVYADGCDIEVDRAVLETWGVAVHSCPGSAGCFEGGRLAALLAALVDHSP